MEEIINLFHGFATVLVNDPGLVAQLDALEQAPGAAPARLD